MIRTDAYHLYNYDRSRDTEFVSVLLLKTYALGEIERSVLTDTFQRQESCDVIKTLKRTMICCDEERAKSRATNHYHSNPGEKFKTIKTEIQNCPQVYLPPTGFEPVLPVRVSRS